MKRKLLALGLLSVLSLSIVGCTKWESGIKDWESDTKGLHRKVVVYSMDGKEIATYESKRMRVNESDGSTITLDFDGRRIVLSNVHVIIEEL